MKVYGSSFLTKVRLRTFNEDWADRSRMQFGETSGGEPYTLSLLGVINGFPILSKYWRLACTIETDSNVITGWSIIKASRCGG